jgi:hypothetical protein
VTNFFEQVAERQLSSAAKTKERVARQWADKRAERERKIMAPTPLEKKQRDAAIQLGFYRKWRSEVKKGILERHGSDFAALVRLLRALPWGRADEVVEFVRNAAWLRRADEQTKFATLSYIDQALILSRIRHGIAEIDDGCLDEEPGHFIRIRRILYGH